MPSLTSSFAPAPTMIVALSLAAPYRAPEPVSISVPPLTFVVPEYVSIAVSVTVPVPLVVSPPPPLTTPPSVRFPPPLVVVNVCAAVSPMLSLIVSRFAPLLTTDPCSVNPLEVPVVPVTDWLMM